MKRIPIMLLAILAGIGTSLAQGPQSWYTLATSRTGDTVRLNDLEPHTWSYYTAASPIHSLNPVDVRIAYYGNGQRYSSTSATPSGALTAVSGVKVGVNENESIYVYYKTLERSDGATTGTGRCPYRTISNPFSVRPTFTSGNTKYYTGFYKWRLKSAPMGGKVYNSAGTEVTSGDMVDADEELAFELSGSNKYINVEFETFWARAYVVNCNSANNLNSSIQSNNLNSTVGYERNFVVITNGAQSNAINNANQKAVTISQLYPDGSGTMNRNRYVTASFIANKDTKFEYLYMQKGTARYMYERYTVYQSGGAWYIGDFMDIQTYDNQQAMGRLTNIGSIWNPSYVTLLNETETADLCANGHNLTIGRSVTPYDDYCARYINGLNAGITSSTNFTMRIESGIWGNFNLTAHYRMSHSNTLSIHGVIGSDYDRAEEDNTKLSLAPSGDVYGGNGVHTYSNAGNRNNLCYNFTIKSGTVQSEKNINNASADECIYLGNTGDANNDAVGYQGKRMLTMEGGEIASIAGGVNAYGANYANYMVNNGNAVIVRIKGGTVRGSIYGAAAFAGASGDRQYIITGGTIRGWIAGGCNGTKTDGGEMYGSTHIYFGGDAQCNSNNNNTAINSSLGGNIFGAGSGIDGGTTVGQVYHSEVVIADNCMVERDVYGGGNYGYVNAGTGHGSDIYIMGGTVSGKVFGGSNQQQGQQVEIQMTGGTVIGGVYGGSNSSGAVSGPVKVNILGGTVGEDGQDDDHGNVFGSGFGVGTSVTGDVYVIIGDSTTLTAGHTTQPFIWGHVFGGGHEANYDAIGHEFKVLGYNGTVNKNIFGGGKGVLNEVKGQITGNTFVQLRGHIHIKGDVFGGGMDGEVRGNSCVIIKD